MNDVHFCFWFKARKFFVEDVEANRQMILSDLQEVWFVDNILEMAKKPT